jgi:hypothetical protein
VKVMLVLLLMWALVIDFFTIDLFMQVEKLEYSF